MTNKQLTQISEFMSKVAQGVDPQAAAQAAVCPEETLVMVDRVPDDGFFCMPSGKTVFKKVARSAATFHMGSGQVYGVASNGNMIRIYANKQVRVVARCYPKKETT